MACPAGHVMGTEEENSCRQDVPQQRPCRITTKNAYLDVHLLRHRPHFGKALRLRAGGCQDLQRTGRKLGAAGGLPPEGAVHCCWQLLLHDQQRQLHDQQRQQLRKKLHCGQLAATHNRYCAHLRQVAVRLSIHAQRGGPVGSKLSQGSQLQG